MATATQPRASSGDVWENIFKETSARMKAPGPTSGYGPAPMALSSQPGGFPNPFAGGGFTPSPGWSGRKKTEEPEVPEVPPFDYEPYRYSGAQAGMVPPQLGMDFMATLPEQMRPMAAAESAQINEMNRRRQMWFDQWKQLMAQAYGQYAQGLAGGRGLFA